MAMYEFNHAALIAVYLTHLQAGLSQQTLDNIASLAWQLSSSPALGEALQAIHTAIFAFTCAPVFSGCRHSTMRYDRMPALTQLHMSVMAFCCPRLDASDAGAQDGDIAGNAVQLAGAVQAPQSSSYTSNLADSIVQLVDSAVSGSGATPSASQLLVQLLQVKTSY